MNGKTPSSTSLRKAIPASMADIGAASLGTFAVQISAVRFLDEQDLGLYALFFSAFVLVKTVPALLVFEPAEIKATRATIDDALAITRRTLRWVRASPAVGLLTLIVAVPFAATSPASVVVPMAATAMFATTIAPHEEHVRRVLHIVGRSEIAASVSSTQLLVVVVAIPACLAAGIPEPWIPFGVLSLGQAASLFLARNWIVRHTQHLAALDLRDLLRSGRWLLFGGLSAPLAAFVSNVVIKTLAGVETLGYVEAARVIARPVMVVGIGLLAVIGPRSLQAAVAGSRRMVARYVALFAGLVAVVGAVMAWSVTQAPKDLIAGLVPNAFMVSGLVAAAVGAAVITASFAPMRPALLGTGGFRAAAGLDALSAATRVAGSFTVSAIGAMAGPLAFAMSGITQWVVYPLALRRRIPSPSRAESSP